MRADATRFPPCPSASIARYHRAADSGYHAIVAAIIRRRGTRV